MKWKMMHMNWLCLTHYETVGFFVQCCREQGRVSQSWNKNKLLSLEVSLLYLVTHAFILRL